MLSSTVEQTTQTVNPAPVRLIYRKPIVGGNVEATVIRDSGDWLRVEVEGEPYHKSIHVTDIVSWILDTTPPATTPSESLKNAPSCDPAPERSSRPFAIKPVDSARALARYSHLAAERYARLEGDRLYYRIPATWTDSQAEVAKSERSLDRVEHHVNRLESLARGEQPAPFVAPPPILYLPQLFRSMFAWMQLEDWRARGRVKYEASPDELMNACKCGNDPEYCTCPKEEAPEPERRGYNPFSMMIAGRLS